jgi:hypothetical protein
MKKCIFWMNSILHHKNLYTVLRLRNYVLCLDKERIQILELQINSSIVLLFNVKIFLNFPFFTVCIIQLHTTILCNYSTPPPTQQQASMYIYLNYSGRPPHPSNTQQHTTTDNNTQQQYTTAPGYIKLPMYQLFLWRLYLMVLRSATS